MKRAGKLCLTAYIAIAILAALGFFPIEVNNDFFEGKQGLWQSAAHGCKVALIIGSVAALTSITIGTSLGFISAWYGGFSSAFILWLATSIAAIPGILLVLIFSYGMGGGISGVFFAVGLVSWVGVYRLVHTEVLNLKNSAHVESARAIGASVPVIALRHVLPCIRPIIGTQFILHFVYAVKAETVLSFLGVGVHQQASWGRMLADAWAFGDLQQGDYSRILIASVSLGILTLALQSRISSRQS
ncbi:MAG: ABC transporter permease [Planctomycetota bacterium]|jgi:peptide/nickel transport system permease protein|nr:ABC transporter permease [Planctomycetota bacterium]